MLESSILVKEISHHLMRNMTHAKEICLMRDIEFKEWTWHEGDSLDHTFYKAKASERVRVNTAAATARRRLPAQRSSPPPTTSDATKSQNTNTHLKQAIKKPKMSKSQHTKTTLVIPLLNSNLKIEPSKPCHVLKLYKKEKSFDSLVKENTLLRERLAALQSGIVNVERCLSDPKDFNDLPELPKPDILMTPKFETEKKAARKKKKKQEIKQLLQVVETSLNHLTKVLDKMQQKI